MMRRLVLLLASAGLAACGSGGTEQIANNQAAAPKKEKPKYCFFKDAESKDWTAKRGKDGNVVVSGKLYRSDGRYMAVLGEPKINGLTAELWPSITTNTTGHSMADGWWDLTATIPNSGAIDTVDVKCGQKTFAELKVPPK
jgi:ABC-type oligopeptide transport system substrate-binding subunit